ncbi:hypothetical protein GOP47_0006865 [Adiantum capillus-veneris]|uniref:Uncharacterized protein n=1 Tax=Adiantum capillus-veneris TaxID=13818 RepID=A0A9D4ZKU7_ADICA|nr:hypothetical protein GOP47_0006865 [Adiantum capillus-veneris]
MATKKQKATSSSKKGSKASWECGEEVMVRANRYKWLQGHVKRLARGGVAVWVEEATLVIHVPLELAGTHLSRSATAPTTATSLLRLPMSGHPDHCLVLAVRPAHLSHRRLVERFLIPVVKTVPTDTDLSVTLLPLTANRPSLLTVEPPSAPEKIIQTPPLSPVSSTSSRVLKLLESIPETQDCNTAPDIQEPPPATRITGSGRFSGLPLEVPVPADNGSVSSSSSTATTPSPGRQSLAERIKKLKIPSSEKTNPHGAHSKSLPSSSWITIIQDGVQNKKASSVSQ